MPLSASIHLRLEMSYGRWNMKRYLISGLFLIASLAYASGVSVSTQPATNATYTLDPSITPLPGSVVSDTFTKQLDGSYRSTASPNLWISPSVMTSILVSTQNVVCSTSSVVLH